MKHPHHPTSLPSPFHRVAACAAVLLASTGLVACETDVHKAMTPEERAAATPLQYDAYATLGYRVEWRGFPAVSPGQQIARMQPLGDVLAVQESGATVSVLETRSGELRWSDPVGNPLSRFVGLNRDGKRLIVSGQSQAYFYDIDTGALLAKQNFELVVNTRPVQVGEILVYGTANGQVLGHLMLNGFRQWGSTLRGAIEVDPVELGDTGVVALASRDGDVAILDGLTGTGRGRARIYDGPQAPMAASDDSVFIASLDHSLYAFGVDGARELWRIRTEAPLRQAPTYHDGRVYCDMGETGLTCYDARSGKQQWANDHIHGAVVAVRNARLVVWDGHTASTLDPARGGTIDSVELKGVTLVRTDKFVDGNLYMASDAGVVTKLTPRK